MPSLAVLTVVAQAARSENPDKGPAIAVIVGVVIAAIVLFALLVFALGWARRRWRADPDERHPPGAVGH